MRTIDVVFPARCEPSYRTPLEAMRGAQTADEQVPLRAELAPYFGTEVTAVGCDDRRLLLRLGSGHAVAFACGEDGPTWQVLLEEPSDPPASDAASDAACDAGLLRLRNGERVAEVVWDRPSLASRIVGKKLTGAQAGEAVFYLYFDGTFLIMFSLLRDGTSGAPLLYWNRSQ